MKLSSFSVIIWSVGLMLMGIALIPQLNIQLNPSRSEPAIAVTCSWPDASARIIEQEVTSKLEGLFVAISGLTEISSVTTKGSVTINMTFRKNANLDAIRFEIATLIRRAYKELPEQVNYPQISLGTSGRIRSNIMTYTLNASASPYFIQQYAEDHIVQPLSRVKGVNDIVVYGATPYEWHITYDPGKLRSLGITVQEMRTAINNHFRSEIVGLGNTIAYDEQEQEIRVILQQSGNNTMAWDDIPVAKANGRMIYLGDVAKTRYEEQRPYSYYRINGLNTINLVVYPEDGANTIQVARFVKEEMQNIRKNLKPGYSILLAYDTTEYLSVELRTIVLRTLASMLILLLFVLLLSRQWRYMALIAFSLFANLIIAVIFYHLLNLEIHLYSLAGITVSFGIIIDNSIVMIDHYRYHKDKKVFLAILAATLTTIGSLCVIFFLEEQQRINLTDFAWVMIVNLSVSLLIALFFIPSLMEKLPLKEKAGKIFYKRNRKILQFSQLYGKSVLFIKHNKWIFILLLILGFGIPVHWLPNEIEKESKAANLYNKTIGSKWFSQSARPLIEKTLGGSLRLFSEHVYQRSFYSDPQRTTLYVRGTMPEGCTVQQLNEAIMKMENYISQFDEVEIFQTSVSNYRSGNINIHFKSEYEYGYFPFYLKELLTTKAISLGGVDWSIYGVGQGFSNALYSGYRAYQIMLEGYNYDQLYAYAEDVRKRLLTNMRVADVEIVAGSDMYSRITPLNEYYLEFDPEMFALHNYSIQEFYDFLNERLYQARLNPVFDGSNVSPVVMSSGDVNTYNNWWLVNGPVYAGDQTAKLLTTGNISKRRMGNDIYRVNQQYRLVVAYNFNGPGELARRVLERQIEETGTYLDIGYKVIENERFYWNPRNRTQYYLIFLVILIVYFICCILLESLLQPLAVILMIPVSFIGVFLTFYLFGFNFDQGGFASFVLLCGLTVNSGLYIINDYNNGRIKYSGRPALRTYIKAYNQKIIPVVLTVLSTVLGLIPFVWGGQNEVFWFAFAAGTIGGLAFSFLAILIYLPLFLKLK